MIAHRNRNRDKAIREEANSLLRKVWVNKSELLSDDLSAEQVVVAALDVIPSLLGYSLEKVQDIPSWDSDQIVAGVINFQKRQIFISNRCPFEQRRFTLAHEIGHSVLHPGMEELHRDRPIDSSCLISRQRPTKEREADVFGAELLMPSKLLTSVVEDCFGGRIFGDELNTELCDCLTFVTGQPFSAKEFVKRTPYNRAVVIASINGFGSTFFEPLYKRFKVSKSAMAIQLNQLGLVT